MESQLRALGALCIAVGLLGPGVAICFFRRFGGSLSLGEDSIEVPALAATAWTALIMLLTIPYIVGGIGLILMKAWSRAVLIVALTCGFLSFPFGTLLAPYGLWVLFSDRADERFDPRRR